MARRIDQFVGKLHHPVELRIVRIEAGLARLFLFHPALRPAPQHAGQRPDRVVGQSEGLADLADRAAPAIADHGRGQVRMIASVFFVDVLDHLFAPLVLEIDVDVGRLVPLFRNEALEQKIDLFGIHLGDLEAIADHRIGRRTAALAQDAPRAREAHDVVHREKVWRVVQVGRDFQLLVERRADFRMSAVRIAPPGSLLGECHQRILRRREAGAVLVRILGVLQFAEREVAAVEEAQRAVDPHPARGGKCAPSPGGLSDAVPHWLRADGRPGRS